MWAKVFGAMLILSATVLWSNAEIAKLRGRVRQLEDFRLALRLLAAEVGYTATPLPRALEQVACRMETEAVQSFFLSVARRLQGAAAADAGAAWLETVRHLQNRLQLTAKDWTVLSRTAAGLGGLGREDQLKQLGAAETQLAAHATAAAAQAAGGEKMWRYLGVLTGMAVVILLL
jgi:stage III sporulation protein AB